MKIGHTTCGWLVGLAAWFIINLLISFLLRSARKTCLQLKIYYPTKAAGKR